MTQRVIKQYEIECDRCKYCVKKAEDKLTEEAWIETIKFITIIIMRKDKSVSVHLCEHCSKRFDEFMEGLR